MNTILKALKTVWREFVYGGHVTALGAPSIAYMVANLCGLPVSLYFLILLYTGAESIYLYDRYSSIQEDLLSNPARSRHLAKHGALLPYIIFVYLIVTIAIPVIFHKRFFLFLLIAIMVMGLLYGNYFKPLTRKIVGFKTMFISLLWTCVPILLLVYQETNVSPTFFLLLVFVLLRELIDPWFCDIKDIENDKKAGLKTFAVWLGKEKLIKVLTVINVLSALPLIVGLSKHLVPMFSVSLLVAIVFTQSYLYMAKRDKLNRANLIYSVIPDIEIILYAPLIIIGKLLNGF